VPIRTRPLAAALALATLTFVTACGDDDDGVASTGTAAEVTTTSTAPTTTTTTAAKTTTTAPATTTTGEAAALVAGTPEADAADAYATVFDSTVAFEVKAAHLDDAEALKDTAEKFAAAAQSFGGIKLTPTAVTIDGQVASVTYDVYFGTTKQYSSLPGSVEDRDGTWTVTRAEFCGFMASARTPCPA
jgi:hypothetical protein